MDCISYLIAFHIELHFKDHIWKNSYSDKKILCEREERAGQQVIEDQKE